MLCDEYSGLLVLWVEMLVRVGGFQEVVDLGLGDRLGCVQLIDHEVEDGYLIR